MVLNSYFPLSLRNKNVLLHKHNAIIPHSITIIQYSLFNKTMFTFKIPSFMLALSFSVQVFSLIIIAL